MLLGTSSFTSPIFGLNLNAGPMWFVCATILVRLYWSILKKIPNDIVLGILISLFGIIAYNIKFYVTLPFSILSSFCALGCFFAGHLARKYDLLNRENSRRIFPICAICLVYCIGSSNIDINLCWFDAYYVIDILACLGAFLATYSIIDFFSNLNLKFWQLLNFIGRYSLAAFCIHAIDQCLNDYWLPFKFWTFFEPGYEKICAVLLRILIVVVGIYIVSKSKFLKEKIFFIK